MKRSQQQTQATPTGHVPAASATKSRRGFTLVELLVVIAIIGILIGMLAVAIGPVLRTVYNGAVATEMKQLELAIENFKNQHGFYPPVFGPGALEISSPAQMVPYLNKLSPNHREVSSGRLAVWFAAIGTNLDDRTSMVFWLSAVTANKQFPITGGLADRSGGTQLPVAYGGSDSIVVDGSGMIIPVGGNNVNRAVNAAGTTIDIPRDSFFDFRGGQLTDVVFNLATRGPLTLPPGIKAYNTPHGEESDNRSNEYWYRNSAAYDNTGVAYYVENDPATTADDVYVNPNTFQLYTYGLDGQAGNISLDDTSTMPEDIEKRLVNEDNITNFANGRLDTFEWRENLGL